MSTTPPQEPSDTQSPTEDESEALHEVEQTEVEQTEVEQTEEEPSKLIVMQSSVANHAFAFFDKSKPMESALVDMLGELSPDNPRYQIRSFLYKLFSFLGNPLPPTWPLVEPSVFASYYHSLRDQISGLCVWIEGKKDIEFDKQMMPRFLGETVLYLMRLEYERPTSFNDVTDETLDLLAQRPQAIIDYDQLYCTADSTQRRADRMIQEFDAPDSKVLFVGDDDLVSVVLAPRFSGEVHMVDLDDRLLDFIGEKSPNVHRHKADFVFDGVDAALYQQYDAVALDPPWGYYRLWCFLEKAMFCLKDNRHARIYMSFCPLHLENQQRKMHRFQKRLTKLGFTFDSIETAFNLYSLSLDDQPEVPGRLDALLPDVESTLLDFIRHVPYVHSQLYVLRRLPYFQPNPVQKWFFKWWNRAK
ncbi:MAG TPA: hypothetical protein DCE42_15815 [Myxococcales bacterium]|nr:hypothetical protein [Deltaproteobacteria bacterium]HAA56231.1 hypothetical protein [Myxococcales bacterium]